MERALLDVMFEMHTLWPTAPHKGSKKGKGFIQMCSGPLPWQHIWGQGLVRSMEVISGPPMLGGREVPFVVAWALPSFSSRGHHPGTCVAAFRTATQKLPWARWSWRKGGRAPTKAVAEGDRRFAEGGVGTKMQCSGWDRAALPLHAIFSFFFCSLLEYMYFLVFTPLVFLGAQQVTCKGLPAGFR